MRLYLCVHCQNDQHHNCERTIPARPGEYGGSKCTCPCDGRKNYGRSPEEENLARVLNPQENPLTDGGIVE